MKKHYFLLVLLATACLTTIAQTFEWVKGIGGVGAEGQSIYSKIDASGNIYSVGSFVGTLDFNPGAGVNIMTSLNGSTDIFILKLDPNGNFLWVKRIAGNNTEYAPALDIDAQGNLYLTGHFNSPEVDFDPGIGNYKLYCFGDLDVFVLKLSPNGDFIWVKQIGGIYAEFSNDITIDNLGNIYITGKYYLTTDFDPSSSLYILNSVNQYDIYILKLNPQGVLVWAKSMGGTYDDEGMSLTIDKFGNVYTTGTFNETCDFDPSQEAYNLSNIVGSNYNNKDVFISKVDSNGLFVWARSLGSISDDIGSKIIIDLNGNIVVSGRFSGQTDFDPGIEQFMVGVAGFSDIFVVTLDSEGNYVWSTTIGGPCDDYVADLESDNNGNLYTIGTLCNVSSSDYDVLTMKLDALGNFKWTGLVGSSNVDRGFSIETDSAGNIYTSGIFQNPVDFDPGEGVSNLTAIGNFDFFIQKLNPDNVSTQAPSTLPYMSLYPNPSNGIYTLKSETQSAFSVIDLPGKTIVTGSVNAEEATQIDLSGFGNGMYFLRVGNQVLKLMKQE